MVYRRVFSVSYEKKSRTCKAKNHTCLEGKILIGGEISNSYTLLQKLRKYLWVCEVGVDLCDSWQWFWF